MRRIFILSPARTTGERAKLIYNPAAQFGLATRLRREPVPLSEVFTFLSGLYFQGKITYAQTFTQPPASVPGTLVITSNRGLLPAERLVTLEEIQAFSGVSIDRREERYLEPLQRDARRLAEVAGPQCEVVFLGSISTERYVQPLLRCFGDRLLFPPSFVGRGDMSRGSLLLRAAADKRELEYAPLHGAIRHGQRPGRLPPRSWGYKVM